MQESVNIKPYHGKSKRGKEFDALQIVIGEYSTLIFPTKIELQYILNILANHHRQQFSEGIFDEDSNK